jgi:hypothetical protein
MFRASLQAPNPRCIAGIVAVDKCRELGVTPNPVLVVCNTYDIVVPERVARLLPEFRDDVSAMFEIPFDSLIPCVIREKSAEEGVTRIEFVQPQDDFELFALLSSRRVNDCEERED